MENKLAAGGSKQSIFLVVRYLRDALAPSTDSLASTRWS